MCTTIKYLIIGVSLSLGLFFYTDWEEKNEYWTAITYVIIAICPIIFTGLGLYMHQYRSQLGKLRDEGTKGNTTNIALEEKSTPLDKIFRNRSFKITYSFMTIGGGKYDRSIEFYESKLKKFNLKPDGGIESLVVFYDPKNPDRNCLEIEFGYLK